jgi:aminopeptidase N
LSSTVPSTPTAGPRSSTAQGGDSGAVGATGIGDEYYPASGNGGYDVAGYQVALQYRPESNALTATTTVTATVTSAEGLRRFNFDLQPTMKVSAVAVNAVPARFARVDAELVVTPAAPLPSRSVFTAVVTYAGAPTVVSGGTSGLGDGGWYRTKSGGALVAGEPFSASAWYPVNEHPSDPATFAVTATVPQKWKVIAGGLEQTTGLPAAPAGMKVFRWVQDVPIASYLTTLYIDTFTVKTSKLDDGTPVVSAIAPGETEDVALHDMTPRVIEVLSKYFGKYPFKAVGGIYSNANIGFALETATRPVYAGWVDPDTVVHELSHQWYGDDVMVRRWADICLNECFASYATWLWHAEVDKADLDAQWRTEMQRADADPSFWRSPLVDMGAGHEFTAVYTRGPLALHALRHQMGDAKFLELLKKWPATYGGRNPSFEDLESMASELAGQDLKPFFQVWFRGTEPPARSDYPAGLR